MSAADLKDAATLQALADLESVMPQPAQPVETVFGDIVVRPLGPLQLPAFVRAILPAETAIRGVLEGQGDGIDPSAVMGLIADHGETVVAAVAVACRMKPDQFEDVDMAEFVDLAMKVIEVNADFFRRRLLPMVTAAVRRTTAAMSGDGATPSQD